MQAQLSENALGGYALSVATRVEPSAAFDDHVLVHCPRCDACAIIDERLRLTCASCGFTKGETSALLIPRSLLAVYNDGNSLFGERLWLATECCGGKPLWALNQRHLDYLEGFVRSRDRDREFPSVPGDRQLADKLPAWLTSQKHRDEVLRAIRRLREKL
jgi:hypothetical protein